MKPLIILRPEPGNAASVAAAEALGLQAIGAPLFTIEPVVAPLPTGPYDAILAGSANAFRHGGAVLADVTQLPVFAVGDTTAAAARAAGFKVAMVGSGGLQAVLDTLPAGPMRVVRLAGRDRVDLRAPPGIEIVEHVVYAAIARPLPRSLAARLNQPSVIALHSAEAARHLAAMVRDKSNLSLACIGPRVAAAAGNGWDTVRSAARPDDAALLALAAEMCQTHAL